MSSNGSNSCGERDNKWSAHRITLELANQGVRISERTRGWWLARTGINHRRFLDPDGPANRRPMKRIVARYPGHMVHLDVKKGGRIPDGGGWRAHGRGSEQARAAQRAKIGGAKGGYVYLHSAVDGFSRLAYTEPLPDEKAATTVAFVSRARAFFAARGIHRVVRVVTDNGANYRAAPFERSLISWAFHHQRTGPPRPGTTARSSASSASSPKNSPTPGNGPLKRNELGRSRSERPTS